MEYELMKPIEGGPKSCPCCGQIHSILPMDAVIGVGFGVANVTKNDREVYSEGYMSEHDWTVQDAENEALKDPDNDWRIHLIAPLSESHYQRQGNGHWVLYEKGEGFA
jgi:hypothetical protein